MWDNANIKIFTRIRTFLCAGTGSSETTGSGRRQLMCYSMGRTCLPRLVNLSSQRGCQERRWPVFSTAPVPQPKWVCQILPTEELGHHSTTWTGNAEPYHREILSQAFRQPWIQTYMTNLDGKHPSIWPAHKIIGSFLREGVPSVVI